jgi:hypothetical protein
MATPRSAAMKSGEMTLKYGRSLESPPRVLPSGWAAVLTLYGLR